MTTREPVQPAALTRLGLDGLRRLRAPHGFDASDSTYRALYGRDALWSILLLAEAVSLGARPEVVAVTREAGLDALRSLAALQGTRVDDRVEEQPGKIPHEYHPHPSSHVRAARLQLADGRSYAGFDETFLFILAYEALAKVLPDRTLLDPLQSNLERAHTWINDYADADGDGFFEYLRREPSNLLNQVWKDSFDSATHTGFDVPPQPLAWIEIQAYAYAVHLAAARRLASRGDPAEQLHRCAASKLAERIDRAFWLGDDEGYAMALDGNKCPVRLASSNPGHALWAGVVHIDRVEPLVKRFTRPDLLSEFGVRSLASSCSWYAPFAYHRGAVWPFDNAVLALGLLRSGHAHEAVDIARRVGAALLRAATPIECYVVLDPPVFLEPGVTRPNEPTLCWRDWPVRNRVQAFTCAALVVFGTLLEAA